MRSTAGYWGARMQLHNSSLFHFLYTFGASGVSHFLFFDEQSGMNITTTPLHFPAKGLIPCTYGAPRASVLSEISRELIYIIDAYSAPYRYIFFQPKGIAFSPHHHTVAFSCGGDDSLHLGCTQSFASEVVRMLRIHLMYPYASLVYPGHLGCTLYT